MSYPIYLDGAYHQYITMENSAIYSARNDYPMECQQSWDQSVLDPSLRSIDNGMMASLPDWKEPVIPRLFIEKDKAPFAGTYMAPSKSPSRQFNFNRQYEAISPIPLPHAYDRAGESPSSVSSSSLSPRTDIDSLQDGFPQCQSFECASPCQSSPHGSSQGVCELPWPSKAQAQPAAPLIKHVNLSNIQCFVDPQEVTFQDDEGYMEDVIEVETKISKPERFRSHYRHSSDEGIGHSVKDEGSPVPDALEPVVNGNVETDEIDADGEDVDGEGRGPEIDEEEDKDTEYNPRAPRAGTKRRRPARTSPTSQGAKKYRVIKNPSRSKFKLRCKDCQHGARDSAALAKHVAAQHTRHYVCTFSFAGCKSTFGNKNEWKRHVTSQHLCLQYWLCNVGVCGQGKASHSSKASNSGRAKGNDFNRKDLFTQHLRRMHAPFSVKRQHRKNDEWDERVKELQSSCLKTRRNPPMRTRCPVRECAVTFEGPNSWDERMEHVGRHLEKTSAAGAGGPSAPAANKEVIDQESDEFMIEWALAERIIERKPSGGYRFCNDAGDDADEEEDAEGEDE